ncbi:MAG: biotin/lipoyl-containing protein, partial [Sulfuricaulis sp.]|nr:biotin/lipoyl-containing protein [Sulfuricaulis sp.]
MSTDITVPVFPESVTEGTILTWHKQPGESVARGELLAEVETDKVVFEVPAPVDGVLTEITMPAGTTVKSGEVVGRLDKSAKMTPKPPPVATETVPKAAVVMPAAKRLMEEHGLDARKLSGSGKGGRVLKEDVQKQLDINETVPAPVAAKPKPAPVAPPAQA